MEKSSTSMNGFSSMAPLWLLIMEGVAAIVIGFFFLFQPVSTLMAIGILLAVFWLIHGISTLLSLIWNREVWGWKLVIGAFGVIVGLSILQAPLAGTAALSVALVILLGAYGLIAGSVEIYMGIDERNAGKTVIGVLTFFFGFVFMLYPVIGLSIIPWMLGLFSIFSGVVILFITFAFNQTSHELQSSGLDNHA